MANINKIRLSGTTYNIEDENASKTVELTQAQYDALATKEPNTYYVITDATAVDMSNYYTKAQTDTALATKQDTLVSGTNIKTINNESILGSGNIEIQGGGGMDDDTQQLISTAFNDLNDRKADLAELSKYQKKGDYVVTSTLSDYMTNNAFDEYATAKERIISGALNDLDNRMIAVESGGSVTVDTTLDSGSTNPVQNAVITQALNSKVDTSAITTAITSGSTDSEIPTAKATYDAIQAGGGGGATYSAGTNISIDTANTINCTLPISAGSGSYSVVFNDSSNIGGKYEKNGLCSLSYGSYSKAHGIFAFAGGRYVNANNYGEMSVGFFNQSNGSSTAIGNSSGNTLFSVGNGTSSARHNAFEIRQNGDIYVNDGTNDVRLQDTILALGGLKLVKLTQAEYDALATKDSSTLYIISD